MKAVIEIVARCYDELIIRDVGHAYGKMTVTNDAEEVVAELHRQDILGGRRLFYHDSEGQLDELRHDGNGKFLGFSPGDIR